MIQILYKIKTMGGSDKGHMGEREARAAGFFSPAIFASYGHRDYDHIRKRVTPPASHSQPAHRRQ